MTNNKTLMILGAGHFMVPALKTAKEMGLKVLVTDRNPDAEGFDFADFHEVADITDVENSIKAAKKYNIDGVIPLNDYGLKTASMIAESLGLIGIKPEVADRAVDKRLMREAWANAGVPCPEFRILKIFEEAKDAVEEIGFPVIAKPPDSMGGSRGVLKINDREELKRAFDFAKEYSMSGWILIEEYVTGDECSVESITYNGKTQVLGISDKTKLPPPYRVDKSVTYPTKHPIAIQKEIEEITKKAIDAIGIDMSASHLELSVTDKGIKLFEIGARTGGGGVIPAIQIPVTYGVNMMKETIKIALGERPDVSKGNKLCGSVFRFITPKPGKVKSVSGVEEALNLEGVVAGACFVKPGDTVNPIKSGTDRPGYLVTKGENREDAIRIADRAEGLIKIETE